LDDPNLENDETVQLGLSLPSPGITLGPSQYALSILDDDALTNAVFVATEGPTGTTNPLVYDELVDLGFGAVGGGPNVGTLVRIANGGGVPMDLGAPSVAGSHPNDFAI